MICTNYSILFRKCKCSLFICYHCSIWKVLVLKYVFAFLCIEINLPRWEFLRNFGLGIGVAVANGVWFIFGTFCFFFKKIKKLFI